MPSAKEAWANYYEKVRKEAERRCREGWNSNCSNASDEEEDDDTETEDSDYCKTRKKSEDGQSKTKTVKVGKGKAEEKHSSDSFDEECEIEKQLASSGKKRKRFKSLIFKKPIFRKTRKKQQNNKGHGSLKNANTANAKDKTESSMESSEEEFGEDSEPVETQESICDCEICKKSVTNGKLCGTITCKKFRMFFCESCFDDHICNKGSKSNSNKKVSSCKRKEEMDRQIEEENNEATEKKLFRSKKVIEKLKENRKKCKHDEKVRNLLKVHLGSVDAVSMDYSKNRRVFTYKCPKCSLPIVEKLKRHLETAHDFDEDRAKLLQSKMRILFLWCISDKHTTHLPLPCEICSEWQTRLDQHLKTFKGHSKMKEEERKEVLEDMKKKYWTKRTANNDDATNDQTEDAEFVRRAPSRKSLLPVQKEAVTSSRQLINDLLYTPGDSQPLSKEQIDEWNIKENDYFTIYFETTKQLLDFFQDTLISSSSERATALQHRNQVELIWASVDESMTMFPCNLLSNIHLFRDYYHIPAFKTIGTSNGVQAGTMRARYVSFGFFLQFLRKYQVFAGLHRSDIQLIEQTVTDFNKDLNPHIKQRKVEVRRNKTKNLLTASHFIKYGQSRHVQELILAFKNRQHRSFSLSFAVDFRNYLITTLCIGNGLRSSNIMELRVKDFHDHTTAVDYPGHKIVVNDNYKTSTIYGEKFIVVPDDLFDHYLFYEKKLRPLIFSGKSSKSFVTPSQAMTQTSVASALTSAFSKAKVLQSSEYQRVSCTRIRCGLATFACNEGGFETAFVANHFMKNKEETTALHYNMLANRRHALNIAMKLYDSFKVSDGVILEANQEEVQKFFDSAPLQDKDKIMKWLKNNDETLTHSEIKSISSTLDELNDRKKATSFYGNGDKVSAEITGTEKKKKGFKKVISEEEEPPVDGNKSNSQPERAASNSKPSKSFDGKAELSENGEGKKDTQTRNAKEVLFSPPKRSSKVFSNDDVALIRRKCYNFINGDRITEESVLASLDGEEILKYRDFKQLRTRIMHERNLISKKKKNVRKSDSSDSFQSGDEDDRIDNVNKHDADEFKRKTYPKRKRNNSHHENVEEDLVPTLESLGKENAHDKDKLDDAEMLIEDSLNQSQLIPSRVIEHCNREFGRPKRRKNVALHRKMQIEKAKVHSVKGKDQEGFEKLYIHQFIKGYGVFTTQEFFEDEYLLTYKGDLITEKEGKERELSYKADENVGSFLYFFTNKTGSPRGNLCVDATYVDGLCKFVNDSENGNCKMSLVRTDSCLYLCLFATQDIPVGTELRYNYGERSKELWWRQEEGCLLPMTKDMLKAEASMLQSNLVLATPEKKRKQSRVKTDFAIEYRSVRKNGAAESIEITD